jgi:hypothetical protein
VVLQKPYLDLVLGAWTPASVGWRLIVSDEEEMLPKREASRIRSRDRKIRGPKVVVDNAGLKKIQLRLAERRRAARPQPKPEPEP